MNFHLPIDSVTVKKYVKYLKSFNSRTVPDRHKKAWTALSYLTSNYHRTADRTAKLAVDLYRGLQIFMERKGA